MPYDLIEQKIIDALNEFGPIAQTNNIISRPEWTIAIQAIFSKLGHQAKYKVAAKKANKKNGGRGFDQIRQIVAGETPEHGEWLYDILWWHQDNPEYMIDVPLVAETEWGNDEAFKYDFQKLLLARSKYKIMVFECGNHIIQWGKEQIRCFKGTQGDRYLFCSWRGNAFGFHFELYVAP